MSRNWRSPEHAKAFVEDARRRGLVAEEPRYAVPQDRHPPYGPGAVPAEPKTVAIGKKRKEMNKTEADYARVLAAMKARGEIVDWEYEGITLRWDDGMRYTADFTVYVSVGPVAMSRDPVVQITLVEIKGSYAWQKDIVKFRAARAKWGNRFRFEYRQKIDGEWRETR